MSPAKVKAPTAATVEALNVNTPPIKEGFNMSDSKAVQASSQPVFSFGEHEVRVVMRDGEPWFVAADVAKALEFRDASNAARMLPTHQKGTHLVSTLQGNQQVTVVSEGGLYRMALRSRKPSAVSFSDWVTDEVLPSIRKTGKFDARTNAGPLTIEMREKVKSMVVQKIDAQQYNAAITLLAKMQVNWEVVDEEPAPPVRYHFPLESADVHDRKCANTWFTPERLTDPKNPTPELDLIKALERDGHDVTGAKVRVLAMRDAMDQMVEMREGLQAAGKLARQLDSIVAVAGEKRGKNVLFVGNLATGQRQMP